MPQTVLAPEVVRSDFDDGFDPLAPVWYLRWDAAGSAPPPRLWELPEGVSLVGPPPGRFGVSVRPTRGGSYAVRVLWDRTTFSWAALSRVELLGSALAPLLAAVGKDLWQMLEPHGRGVRLPRRAA